MKKQIMTVEEAPFYAKKIVWLLQRISNNEHGLLSDLKEKVKKLDNKVKNEPSYYLKEKRVSKLFSVYEQLVNDDFLPINFRRESSLKLILWRIMDIGKNYTNNSILEDVLTNHFATFNTDSRSDDGFLDLLRTPVNAVGLRDSVRAMLLFSYGMKRYYQHAKQKIGDSRLLNFLQLVRKTAATDLRIVFFVFFSTTDSALIQDIFSVNLRKNESFINKLLYIVAVKDINLAKTIVDRYYQFTQLDLKNIDRDLLQSFFLISKNVPAIYEKLVSSRFKYDINKLYLLLKQLRLCDNEVQCSVIKYIIAKNSMEGSKLKVKTGGVDPYLQILSWLGEFNSAIQLLVLNKILSKHYYFKNSVSVCRKTAPQLYAIAGIIMKLDPKAQGYLIHDVWRLTDTHDVEKERLFFMILAIIRDANIKDIGTILKITRLGNDKYESFIRRLVDVCAKNGVKPNELLPEAVFEDMEYLSFCYKTMMKNLSNKYPSKEYFWFVGMISVFAIEYMVTNNFGGNKVCETLKELGGKCKIPLLEKAMLNVFYNAIKVIVQKYDSDPKSRDYLYYYMADLIADVKICEDEWRDLYIRLFQIAVRNSATSVISSMYNEDGLFRNTALFNAISKTDNLELKVYYLNRFGQQYSNFLEIIKIFNNTSLQAELMKIQKAITSLDKRYPIIAKTLGEFPTRLILNDDNKIGNTLRRMTTFATKGSLFQFPNTQIRDCLSKIILPRNDFVRPPRGGRSPHENLKNLVLKQWKTPPGFEKWGNDLDNIFEKTIGNDYLSQLYDSCVIDYIVCALTITCKTNWGLFYSSAKGFSRQSHTFDEGKFNQYMHYLITCFKINDDLPLDEKPEESRNLHLQ